MTRFAKLLTLGIFVFAFASANVLLAQDAKTEVETVAKMVAKVGMIKTSTPMATADVVNVPHGEVIYDESMIGHGYHGGVVQGKTYQAAPHVTYGAGLGTPSFGQVEHGVWYNGPTWGLFPKAHRANAPHKNRSWKSRFLPASWRR